ncbi:hypothetical protein JMJ77_0001946, partial [Colletotrichum scovillei]
KGKVRYFTTLPRCWPKCARSRICWIPIHYLNRNHAIPNTQTRNNVKYDVA